MLKYKKNKGFCIVMELKGNSDGQNIEGAARGRKARMLWKSFCFSIYQRLKGLRSWTGRWSNEYISCHFLASQSKACRSYLCENLLHLTMRNKGRRGCGFFLYLQEVNVSDSDEILSLTFQGCLQLTLYSTTACVAEDILG